jgi:hypothetical protein
MTKDYKIEAKPNFWEVTLESGAYSDWTIETLCFSANSPIEAWDCLCRYLESIYDKDSFDSVEAIVLDKSEKRYAVKAWLDSRADWEKDKGINWDTYYGNAKLVKISMLKVIHFQR